MASKDLFRAERSRPRLEQASDQVGRIRWSHVITLAALMALGPLGTDLYLPMCINLRAVQEKIKDADRYEEPFFVY